MVTGRVSRMLSLDGLGLGDEHALIIASLAEESLIKLSLKSNPAIGTGYESILWLLNRSQKLEEIGVVDECWQAKIDLVIPHEYKVWPGCIHG
jgi:hypothetical protein